ncbi:hypothetical protein O6H91_12G043100 [Diphasiastrum complanatum]|uniref:Uncharacterized protein n=2 Tax=Diphasiastrum complanatum TaxID=34168 RepID=A0ACC2C114_DIPCM|nr:hypothetical protein O6H91_Y425100 [Diphasiastrum complanatum]KAJ7248650.1 hypothetical protein O6H91_Y425100 [Diphasiastrum complanatum]KAJ7535704.1 hypothetical protein O6H91_12G043100 [Diphasiastrum complanatum]KAJ7535705.1 hypothetical protein O6H91_12G043100 [Diphasiastrum complanatum]
MASGVAHTEWVNINQIVREFFTKSLQVILESRIPNFTVQGQTGGITAPSSLCLPLSGLKPVDNWFNLVLTDCPTIFQVAEPWRTNILDPMVVDILLLQPRARRREEQGVSVTRKTSCIEDDAYRHALIGQEAGDLASSQEDCVVKTILERWVIWYDTHRADVADFATSDITAEEFDFHSLMSGGLATTAGRCGKVKTTGGRKKIKEGGTPLGKPPHLGSELPSVYSKAVISLRSLYCILRALPAHNLFRLANSSLESCNFSLAFKVSTVVPSFSHSDQLAMTPKSLTSLETQWGKICLSVAYRDAAAVTAVEIISSIQPRIISDYVGSPNTDPLRRFTGHSQIGSSHSGGLSGRREVHVISMPSGIRCSPTVPCFVRCHSWSEEKWQTAFQLPSSVLPSSCPSGEFLPDTESFKTPRAAPSQRPPFRSNPSTTSPLLPNDEQGLGSQPAILENKYSSSPFSCLPPSSLYCKDHSFKGPSSAPVMILRQGVPRKEKSPKPDRGLLPPQSPQSRTAESSSQGASNKSRLQMGQMQERDGPPLGRKTYGTLYSSNAVESTLLILHPNPVHVNQLACNVKIVERLPSDQHCPTLTSSRSACKSSFKDNSEEEKFACPFAVEENEATEYRGRIETAGLLEPPYSDALTFHKSQAAAGALARILQLAAPLHQSAKDKPSLRPNHIGLTRVPTISGGLGSERLPVGGDRITSQQKSSKQQITPFSAGKFCKTTYDALEELRGYQELKDFLQRQSGRNLVSEQ